MKRRRTSGGDLTKDTMVLGHEMRREENGTVREALERKPHGKIPGERPGKRCIYVVEEDLKTLGVENRRELVQGRDGWRGVVMTAKNSRRADMPNEEEDGYLLTPVLHLVMKQTQLFSMIF